MIHDDEYSFCVRHSGKCLARLCTYQEHKPEETLGQGQEHSDALVPLVLLRAKAGREAQGLPGKKALRARTHCSFYARVLCAATRSKEGVKRVFTWRVEKKWGESAAAERAAVKTELQPSNAGGATATSPLRVLKAEIGGEERRTKRVESESSS